MEGNVNANQQDESNGLAVSSMVLGIIGLVLVIIPIIPYPLAILAIVFGVIGKKNSFKKGYAITGLITGIVTLGLKIWFLAWVAFFM